MLVAIRWRDRTAKGCRDNADGRTNACARLICGTRFIPILIPHPGMASSGPLAERVTVTMPAELVAGIDRIERNRSRFIAEAVRHELQRRQRLELQRSLQTPHPDSLATAALGLTDWAEAMSDADNDLLDPEAGIPLAWRADTGWVNSETPLGQP